MCLCLGVCILRGHGGSPHRGGPATHGHERAGQGAEWRGPERPEPIRGASASTRHWLMNRHRQQGDTLDQPWTYMMRTHKQAFVYRTILTNTHMNSSRTLCCRCGEYEDVCRSCVHVVSCAEDCCWSAVLNVPIQGAAVLYEGLCMRDPHTVLLPAHTHTHWKDLGSDIFCFLHVSRPLCQRQTALDSNRSSYFLQKTKLIVNGPLINMF